MPLLFDPMFLLFLAPALLLAMWAQARVHGAYGEASRVGSMSGMSGAEAARELLDLHGLRKVTIEQSRGYLSDHYDPRHKVLRLSPEVYGGTHLAALGIAAHEAGHAIQDQQNYGPLTLRNGLVPLAAMGGQVSSWLLIGGIVLLFMGGGALGSWLLLAGIALFSLTVLFQLVNLPVEFDASRRAKAALVDYGIVHEREMPPIRKVLSAAAMTYVAATLTGLVTLLYYVFLLMGRRE